MFALAGLFMVLLGVAAPSLQAGSIGLNANTFLADLGLIPRVVPFPSPRSDVTLLVTTRRTSDVQETQVGVRGRRVDLIVMRLSATANDPLRAALLSGLGQRYCQKYGSMAEKVALLVRSVDGDQLVSNFECGSQSSRPSWINPNSL
jgi:hypothetical protein